MIARMKLVLIYFILINSLGCNTTTNSNNLKNMVHINLEELTIKEIQQAFKNGVYTISDLTQAYLNRIDSLDQKGPKLNSIIHLNPNVIEQAKQLDQEFKDGKNRGPLHGIPILLKDNINTKDMPTTAGAIPLKNSIPLEDSWVTKKLVENGAIILGKTNLSEWANFHSSFSSSGWSALGGQTKNPYKLNCNPCGSSAGSGVAVSANLCVVAIGTETNGSIMCPSNHNGIVGIKPTVGLVSRAGIIPISETQDTAGPMARTVEDAAIVLSVLTGVDPNDFKTRPSLKYLPANFYKNLRTDYLKGKKMGLFLEPMGKNEAVDQLMHQAISHLEKEGVEIIAIDKISEENLNIPSYQVLLYEFKDGLNKYFNSLGKDAKVKSLEDLIEKTFSDSTTMQYFDHAILKEAQAKGDLNEEEYKIVLAKMIDQSRKNGIDKIMKKYNLDAIITPTGSPAWEIDLVKGDSYENAVFSSSPAAISGYPSITVPMGFIDELPVGISFFGAAWTEKKLINLAYAYEQGTKHRRVPRFLEK